MPATNVIANLFVTLYNNEARRRSECTILPTSKLGVEVLETLKKHGYIGDFERIEDGRGGKFKVQLAARITKCGAISPRFKVSKNGYNKWEQQYLPAYNQGMLLVTTSEGVMSHHEAMSFKDEARNIMGIGGLLIGYVYGPLRNDGRDGNARAKKPDGADPDVSPDGAGQDGGEQPGGGE